MYNIVDSCPLRRQRELNKENNWHFKARGIFWVFSKGLKIEYKYAFKKKTCFFFVIFPTHADFVPSSVIIICCAYQGTALLD